MTKQISIRKKLLDIIEHVKDLLGDALTYADILGDEDIYEDIDIALQHVSSVYHKLKKDLEND